MKSPEISVIVPVYKVEAYLSRCVDSILSQTFKNIEVILVDDGSPDSCGDLCDMYALKDCRIKVIHKTNGGLSDARNVGIDASNADYILLIDSDDYIEPNTIETLYCLICKYNADISACGFANCYTNGRFLQNKDDKILVWTGKEAFTEILKGEKISAGIVGKLIRKSVIGTHRFLKGKTYEDAFFNPQLFFNTKKFVATTESLYNYWHRSGSITTEPFNEKSLDVIYAYEYTLNFVKTNWPDLYDVALFRLQWAYFVVLDRIIEENDFRQNIYYHNVIEYLTENWLSVIKSSFFRRTRKFAALMLKCDIRLYRILYRFNERKIRRF